MPQSLTTIATTRAELLERFDVFLLDAYGVLVTSQGALPGAAEFINELDRRARPYLVVTNDGSRLPETASAYYRSRGVQIPAERVLTAGMAIGQALNEINQGKPLRCLVLGPLETQLMVERAGHLPVALDAREIDGAGFDALVVGDDGGFDFLPTMNRTITALHRARLRGLKPALLLANSDLLYPAGHQSFGFTSGAIAQLLESAIDHLHPLRDGDRPWRFEVLGKPSTRIFDMALKILGSPKRERVCMLGDQLHTDVLGANRSKIASVLLGTGITPLPLKADLTVEMRPQYVLTGL